MEAKKKEYSWEWLEQQPYSVGLWDVATIDKERRIVFMAREPREDVEPLPKKVIAHWKAGLLPHKKVLVLVVMCHFIPLNAIYEFWFNYIHDEVKEAVDLLSRQGLLYLNFHEVGPTPVRTFAFHNGMRFDFVLLGKKLKEVAPWMDAEFEEAKAAIQAKYAVRNCGDS